MSSTIDISLGAPCGAIRAIHGINNSPSIVEAAALPAEKEAFRALRIPRVRHHDAPIENSRYELVDVSRLFPLWRADENDPANYDFRPTDDYFAIARECGADIEFRLGETIEHSPRRYRVMAPEDPAKWARICVNIVRHYNEGWADGYHWNIRRWSIWEEPDNIRLLDSPDEDDHGRWGVFESRYLALYEAVSKLLKREFPDILVGGPQTMGASMDKLGCFLSFCKETDSPVDFLAWTCYTGDPEQIVRDVRAVRTLLDGSGFPKAEVHLAEWHLGPKGWSTLHVPENREYMTSVHSGAFAAQVLTLLQDEPVDMAYFYGWGIGYWGLWERSLRRPYPVWHAFKAFADMTECTRRLAVECTPAEGVSVLAGELAEGGKRVLVSCYKSAAHVFKLRLPGAAKVNVTALTETGVSNFDIESAPDGLIHCAGNDGGSAVYLFRA